jgi:hypothetical protein
MTMAYEERLRTQLRRTPDEILLDIVADELARMYAHIAPTQDIVAKAEETP